MGRQDPLAALLDSMSDERIIAWAELTDEQLDQIVGEFTEELPADDPLTAELRERLGQLRDRARTFQHR